MTIARTVKHPDGHQHVYDNGHTVTIHLAIDKDGVDRIHNNPNGIDIEYRIEVPRNNKDGTPKDIAQIRDEVIAAVQAQRKLLKSPSPPVLPGIPDSLTIPD